MTIVLNRLSLIYAADVSKRGKIPKKWSTRMIDFIGLAGKAFKRESQVKHICC